MWALLGEQMCCNHFLVLTLCFLSPVDCIREEHSLQIEKFVGLQSNHFGGIMNMINKVQTENNLNYPFGRIQPV